jgi:hypothetical protein
MTTLSRAVALWGTEEARGESRELSTGPLSAVFESGALRGISYAGTEVIRGIAFLCRDKNWATYNAEFSDLEIDEGEAGFRVSYRGRCADGEQALFYEVEIVGSPDGACAFKARAAAETDFLTNRTGFIVLHPLVGVAGQPVRVERVTGQIVDDRFPLHIAPSQPFFDIRSLSHEVVPGLWATCTMEGDAYEMEDQRNWTDASYKTYVRPLSLPRPYTVKAGEEIQQSITLTF